jgi:hypothetical protein
MTPIPAAAARADMRFDSNAAGQILLLNKADGTIRVHLDSSRKWRRFSESWRAWRMSSLLESALGTLPPENAPASAGGGVFTVLV